MLGLSLVVAAATAYLAWKDVKRPHPSGATTAAKRIEALYRGPDIGAQLREALRTLTLDGYAAGDDVRNRMDNALRTLASKEKSGDPDPEPRREAP